MSKLNVIQMMIHWVALVLQKEEIVRGEETVTIKQDYVNVSPVSLVKDVKPKLNIAEIRSDLL